MLHWEAAFVVLFEKAKGTNPNWNGGPGEWCKYTDVARPVPK